MPILYTVEGCNTVHSRGCRELLLQFGAMVEAGDVLRRTCSVGFPNSFDMPLTPNPLMWLLHTALYGNILPQFPLATCHGRHAAGVSSEMEIEQQTNSEDLICLSSTHVGMLWNGML